MESQLQQRYEVVDCDDDGEYDFLWYKSAATSSEKSLRVQKMQTYIKMPLHRL